MTDIIYNESSNNNFFEGVEKLLEIWLSKSPSSCGSGDARTITRKEWEVILDYVECKILDVIENEGQVAYLLSESSLFVSKQRIILKTCGTTLCLHALPHILKIAKSRCGLDVVADCFYSRKNFMKPDNQPHPYRTFQDEIVYLDKILSGVNREVEKCFDDADDLCEQKPALISVKPEYTSASYCLGRLDGDCWFLYTLNHPGNNNLVSGNDPDQTLEILMSDLDHEAMSQFSLYDEHGFQKSSKLVTKLSGVEELLPGSKISAFLFDPCGYSLNGLLPQAGYWTIHITPEEEFSYVSFETNVPMEDYSDLIDKVLQLFKPGRFTMTLFANHNSAVDTGIWAGLKNPRLKGFKQLDKQVAQLQDYHLYYTNYVMNTEEHI